MATPILLSADLTAKMEEEANRHGLSPAEFVNESLKWIIEQKLWDNPLFSDCMSKGVKSSYNATTHDYNLSYTITDLLWCYKVYLPVDSNSKHL